MAMLGRYPRSFSFHTTPFMDNCSLLVKFRRKVGECKDGCSNLTIIIVIYTYILLT